MRNCSAQLPAARMLSGPAHAAWAQGADECWVGCALCRGDMGVNREKRYSRGIRQTLFRWVQWPACCCAAACLRSSAHLRVPARCSQAGPRGGLEAEVQHLHRYEGPGASAASTPAPRLLRARRACRSLPAWRHSWYWRAPLAGCRDASELRRRLLRQPAPGQVLHCRPR